MFDLFRNSCRWRFLPGLALLALSSLLSAQGIPSPAERLRAADPVPGSALNTNGLRLEIPDEEAIDFDLTESFTIEAWFRIEAFKNNNDLFVGKERSYLIRRDGNSGRLEFATERSLFEYDTLTTIGDVPVGEWFHLAAVYDGVSKTKQLYIDGVLQGTQVIKNLQSTNLPFTIGGSELSNTTVNASIDGLRLWSSARSLSQLLADMDRDLTVFDPDTANADRKLESLLAEWRFNNVSNGSLPDSSGPTLRDARVGKGSIDAGNFVDGLDFRPAPPLATDAASALEFDGMPDSRVTVPDRAMLNPTAALTLEAWIQVGEFSQPWQTIVAKGDAWGLSRFGETSRISFRTRENGTVDDLAGATDLLPNRWYHVAGTWDGMVKRLYLDGNLDAVAEWSGPLDVAPEALLIGDHSTPNRAFIGSIDNVRLWARTRSVAQIEAGRWTDLRGFESGLRGDWRFNEESGSLIANDNSYLKADGTLGAAVTRVDGLTQGPLTDPVADVPPPAGGALYFPSDLAMKSNFLLPVDDRLNSTEALTVEAWVSLSAYANKTQAIVTKGRSWALVVDPLSGFLNFQTMKGSGTFPLRTMEPLGLNDWHHIAAVFDGGTKRIYVDGELKASVDFVGPLDDSSLGVVFSGNSDTTSGQVSMRGRLDSVRIWSDVRSQQEIRDESARELRGTEQGLAGVWRFDDEGEPGFDSSWHRLHGISYGNPEDYAPQTVAGLPFALPPDGPLAIDFNRDSGDADCIQIGSPAAFEFTTQMSVETWVRIDAVPQLGDKYALISKGSGAWEVLIEDNGKINFHTAGLSTEDLFSTNRIEPGEWYHVAVVWNGPQGDKEIYINGQLDNSRDELTGEIAVNGFPVILGARPLDASGGKDTLFQGTLDEVRVWKVALPGPQIRSAFDNQLFGSELGLVGYWPFSQGGRMADGSESMAALDQTAGGRAAITGSFSSGMGILNRVDGVMLGEPDALQYALSFNGTDEFVEVPADDRFTRLVNSLTIEAWVRPEGSGLRTVLMQGDLGFGLAIGGDNRLRYFADGNPVNSLASTGAVTNGEWQHVAVVVDGAAQTTTFYINGLPVGSHPGAGVTVRPGQPLILGKLGPFGGSYFKGLMDEVRVWTRARSFTEMAFFALQPLPSGSTDGLAGYWQFNEGRGTVAGNQLTGSPDGGLVKMDDSNWRYGHFFEGSSIDGSLTLSPTPESQGLWMGTVVLDRVNEVQTAVGGSSDELTPTGDALTVRVLLHVNASGAMSLLKDVVVMAKPNPDGGRDLVLLTDPTRIPEFEGVVERGGKRVGLRYGSVDYEFDGLDLAMLGGIAPANGAVGKIVLAADHPNNPFRHKYHNQHRQGFALTRQFSFNFDAAPDRPETAAPDFGTEWISGDYRETISGLHKIPLKTGGRFELRKINNVGSLNAN